LEKFGIVLAKLEIYSDKINNFTIKTREKLKDLSRRMWAQGNDKLWYFMFHLKMNFVDFEWF
jgi:hypothetical protein